MSDTPTPAGKGQWTLVTKPADLDMPAAGMGHSEDKMGAEPESVRAGHEPDWFDARGVVYVPILVVVSAAATYGLVTLMFNYFDPGTADTRGANPRAAMANAVPYNERVRDISSQDPAAEVKQPRLEAMRAVEKKHPDEPLYYRSMRPTDTGNPPEVRPEDLRPENFVDWTTGEKPLVDYKWVNKDKGVARIPVGEAIKILATQKKLPAKAGRPAGGTGQSPTLANGGQGDAAPAAKDEPKKDDHDHKKDEPKKDE
jgi:hypothetical protein